MEPVLRFRQQLEDEARQNLFTSLEKEGKIRKLIADATNRLDILYTSLAWEEENGTTVDRLLLFENRIAVEKEELGQLLLELEEQEKEVARRRGQLLHASQDKKALEKLKERQNLAYRQFKEKQEATMLDEIAVLRHGR